MEEGHVIKAVLPGSIGEELELEPGDRILAVNNQTIEDVFDYQYLIDDEYIELTVQKIDGEEWILEIEKDADEDLGITFESVSYTHLDVYKRQGWRGPLYPGSYRQADSLCRHGRKAFGSGAVLSGPDGLENSRHGRCPHID